MTPALVFDDRGERVYLHVADFDDARGTVRVRFDTGAELTVPARIEPPRPALGHCPRLPGGYRVVSLPALRRAAADVLATAIRARTTAADAAPAPRPSGRSRTRSQSNHRSR